ncbi:pectinesterase family protein [Streptomyces sp. NBC_00582]|uniref:pectinesterase family protein n=1 Tax=Streptomyces sp. NBC_00582 TaxID=2975783 RepID=UPI002E809AC9|nr:pectinesterase family protein [Streptomyces sp. NBC_00582]WUB67137.1 pectinesterase family protein [Streptomyces sp. NBC_00582]
MTSTTQGGLPRRSFLAAATAVSLAAAGGLVLAGAPSASATEPTTPDVNWVISSEPGDAFTGYRTTITRIREVGRAGQLPVPVATGARPVPAVAVTNAAGTDSYIRIDLRVEDRREVVRVFMRTSDFYIMGWRSGTAAAPTSSTVAWGDFFTLDPAVNLPNAVRGGPNGNVVTRFEELANYSDLAQQGATRNGLQLTPASLGNAVITLAGGQSATTRNAAQAILQIIVALAEGARFRNQARATATAFHDGQPFTVSSQHIAQHNNWGIMSQVFINAALTGVIILTAPLTIGGEVFLTTAAIAYVLMTAHHSNIDSWRRQLTTTSQTVLCIQPDGFGDYPTIQDAVNGVPSDGTSRIVYLDKGTYQETVVVPASKSNLVIKAMVGLNPEDVVITADRAHGMTNPATGQPYGTEGSAVLTVKAPGATVAGITIQNTFDPAKHPEIDAFSTQAVALAAEGDRQTFTQCRIIARQDTVLCKAPVPTGQYRQYFVACYVEGAIDFIFGNATAVFDRCNIAMQNWVGGTVLAPNTDYRQKYGILITGSEIFTNGVPENTMYLGRPWHNVAEAWPQAVVRDTKVHSGVNTDRPWTDMTPDYPWSWGRFKEYHNFAVSCSPIQCIGVSVGGSTNPQLTDSEAADYTAQKYLAGTDGWNPVFPGS